MARRKPEPLDVIREIPDQLWERIEPILLEARPPKDTGRSRADWRRCLNGIVHRMRSGCQWNHMPERFGDDSTVHRWFQTWNRTGATEKVWAALVAECDELGAVEWKWQSADARMGKARFGGIAPGRIRPTGPSPARRPAL